MKFWHRIYEKIDPLVQNIQEKVQKVCCRTFYVILPFNLENLTKNSNAHAQIQYVEI